MNCRLLPHNALLPGVTYELAQMRSSLISDIRYKLHYDIPRLKGRLRLTFNSAAEAELPLDFCGELLSLSVNGISRTPVVEDEHILIPVKEGSNDVEADFEPVEEYLHLSGDWLYTLSVPANARYLFPCMDQPDLKARFTLTLDLPQGWTAVGNVAPGDETKPIPTYLFAFAAGRLKSVASGSITAYMPESVEMDLDDTFRMLEYAKSWMERYTGIPLPWPKADVLILPQLRFAGMEHPGCIFFRQEKASASNTLMHETVHLWVGDLATMKWFSDVWIKEGLANFLADKIAADYFGESFDREERRQFRIGRALTAQTQTIGRQLDNLNHAMDMYGPLSYQKAALVLHQLEREMGEEHLRAALSQLLRDYAYSAFDVNDFKAILQSHTPDVDIAAFFDKYIDSPDTSIYQ